METDRAVLTTTPQGQAVDAQFVKWLMDHQKEAGVFTAVSGLVEQLSDNPAADDGAGDCTAGPAGAAGRGREGNGVRVASAESIVSATKKPRSSNGPRLRGVWRGLVARVVPVPA